MFGSKSNIYAPESVIGNTDTAMVRVVVERKVREATILTNRSDGTEWMEILREAPGILASLPIAPWKSFLEKFTPSPTIISRDIYSIFSF